MPSTSTRSAPRHRRLLARSLLALAVAATLGAGQAPARPTARDRCAACGMTVADHPDWVAQIVYEDGHVGFFDGPKCLFRLARGSSKNGGRRGAIREVWVTSYYDRTPLRAEGAWFVHGSDVLGPMGKELVPHRTREEAEEFLKDHHGAGIVRYDEITADLLRSM